MGLFSSDYTNHELVEVVRVVTLHVNPRQPKNVSLRKFDGARAAAGHPRAPRASRICERFDMRWPALKDLAHDPGRSVEQTLGIRLRVRANPEMTLDQALDYVRAISSRLGGAPLDPAIYVRERDVILTEVRRRWRHGQEIVIPTANQIATLAGTFRNACLLAGVPVAAQTRAKPSRWAWTDKEIIEALICLMDENPGVAITQRSYRTLRAGRPEFPPVSVLNTVTNDGRRPGLVFYRAEAERRRRERERRIAP